MNIQKNIEQAKKYISDNKLDSALRLLKKLLKLDSNIKEEIFLEVGKIYFIQKKYRKSKFYLNKIKKESLKQFSCDLLFQIYDRLKCYNKIINIFDKFGTKNINEYVLYTTLKSCCELKKISKIFSIINIIRSNNVCSVLLENLIKDIYKNLAYKIQMLNSKNKKKEVEVLFKKIYKNIPIKDIKFKNVILNEYEIAKHKIYLKSYPRIAQVVITTSCNLKCVMCSENNHNAKYVFSDKQFNDLVEIMPYLQRLVLRGGEVFLYKNFDRLLDEIYKNDVSVEILTNGLLLNEKNINKLIKMNAVLNFSIDSPIKETYEFIRKGAKFENLIYNILLLNKIKKEMKSNAKFNINMVVMKRNYKEIPDMIKFAKKYNFQGLNLNPIFGTHNENCFTDNIDKSIIKELREKRKEYELMAKNNEIELINKLPDNVPNENLFLNKNTDNVDEFIIKEIRDKKRKEYKVISKNSNTNLINKLSENIPNNINKMDSVDIYQSLLLKEDIKMFCHAPWREVFIDDVSYRSNCLCEKNIKFDNLKSNNSIIEFWNSNFMKEYRKKISMKKEYEVCSKECLRNKYNTFDRYRVI